MKSLVFLLVLFVTNLTWAGDNFDHLLSPQSDPGFGGFYLDIEKTMAELGVTRLEAHEIQNQMRDELEYLSGSFSRLEQRQYLEQALPNAVANVRHYSANEGGFKPINFGPSEYVIVLDLDETMLSQWYPSGSGNGADRNGIPVTVRDSFASNVDRKTGNSGDVAHQSFSGASFIIRPGANEFLQEACDPQFCKGFIVFTAKEDRAAWEIKKVWEQIYPESFKQIIGFYTRNYLRFDGNTAKPSKDLRLFDPSLNHVFLIDDNEGRVLQPELNYRAPKYNPEALLPTNDNDLLGLRLNLGLFKMIDWYIGRCNGETLIFGTPSNCLKTRLGTKDDQYNHVFLLLEYMNTYRFEGDTWAATDEIFKKYFDPEFHIAIVKELREPFPRFEKGILKPLP